MTIQPPLATPDPTETQVAVLDTLRSVTCHLLFLSMREDDPVRISVSRTLESQGLTWGQFVDFAGK